MRAQRARVNGASGSLREGVSDEEESLRIEQLRHTHTRAKLTVNLRGQAKKYGETGPESGPGNGEAGRNGTLDGGIFGG